MYAERLNEYDEQLKSKDTKEGQVCLFCNDMWRRGHVGPLHWSAQTDYTKNYRPFVLDVACPLIARLERTQLKVEETILGELDAERKEALAKLVVPLQVSRLKVLQAMNDIEISKVWGKWKKLDDARTTCDFAVADAERADAELSGEGSAFGTAGGEMPELEEEEEVIEDDDDDDDETFMRQMMARKQARKGGRR